MAVFTLVNGGKGVLKSLQTCLLELLVSNGEKEDKQRVLYFKEFISTNSRSAEINSQTLNMVAYMFLF